MGEENTKANRKGKKKANRIRSYKFLWSKELKRIETEGLIFVLDTDPHSIKRLRTKYLEQGVEDVRGFIDGAFMVLCVNLEDDDKEKIPYVLRSKVLEYEGILKGVI